MTKPRRVPSVERAATFAVRPRSRAHAAAAHDLAVWLAITVVTVAIRYPLFGDPLFHIDEQFYLLVGDRMLHGAVPYVDIWDRKPIGLFLLFAGFRLLPGDGILAYQIAATVCAALTAAVIARIVKRFAGPLPAVCGGVIYIVACEFMGGGGGQSPVFYNLPVAVAALLVLRGLETDDPRRMIRDGGCAMLLMGISIQIKYTAAIEGAYLGCVLLWSLHRAGLPVRRVAPLALGFAMLGLAPTVLAAAYYVHVGHFAAFWYANFVSIAQRGPLPEGMAADFLFYDMLIALPMLPLLAVAIVRIRRTRDATARAQGIVTLGWLAAALVGFLSIGSFFNHYALPVLVPLAILCGIACRGNAVGPLYVGLWLATYVVHFEPGAIARRDLRAALVARMVRVSAPYAGHCMQVFSGQPIVQLLTHACSKTRFAFPEHLVTAREQHAIGVDQLGALRALLSAGPGVVIAAPQSEPGLLAGNMAVLNAALAAHYRPVFRVPTRAGVSSARPAFIFVRSDLLPPARRLPALPLQAKHRPTP